MKVQPSSISVGAVANALSAGPSSPASTYAPSQFSRAESDTVVLSPEATAAWANERNSPNVDPDIKAAALPSWYADYHPTHFPLELGLTVMQIDALNARFNSLSPSEESLYYPGIRKHFSAMLEANGLTDSPEIYERLISNKQSSEKYQLDFERRLMADKPLMALLTKMGFRFHTQAEHVEGENHEIKS